VAMLVETPTIPTNVSMVLSAHTTLFTIASNAALAPLISRAGSLAAPCGLVASTMLRGGNAQELAHCPIGYGEYRIISLLIPVFYFSI